MTPALAFLAGMVIGGTLGVIVMAVLVMASEEHDRE